MNDNASSIISKVWSFCNTLRDDGVGYGDYRVNSKRGTQFRIWAARVLREHLLQGYTVNERRLRDLNQAVRLIAGVADRRDLSGDEAKALLAVVGEYRFALDLPAYCRE
ncbi:MAG: RhuM family protein [Deltaproteobacteria bacterium]|nr:RhuM family protein [Deltaproteobacteria bacterium]